MIIGKSTILTLYQLVKDLILLLLWVKAMLFIAITFAQLERDTIAERIRDNMYKLAKTGRWLGGNVPLGFISEKVEKLNINGKKNSFI